MKTFMLPLSLVALLCSCQSSKIAVAWPPGYAYVPNCKPQVKYQGASFEIQGVKIPVPQLGGAAEVGGVKVDPKVLNQAYYTTQILDTSYHDNCELLRAFSTDKAKFEAAVQEMRDSQTKLAQLAISLQSAQQPTASPAPQPTTTTSAKPAASPAATTSAAKPATSPAPQPAAKAKAVKHRLANWVASYSKKSKAATVKTPAKPNTSLGLPASAPTPTPVPK
jgi:hypothetical protein